MIWWGDVLFWFGVFGLVLFPFRHCSPAFLLTAGGVLLSLQIPVAVVEHIQLESMRDKAIELQAAVAAGKTLTEEERTTQWAWEQKKRELDPTGKDLAKEVEAQRTGWWKLFLRRAQMAARMQSLGVYQNGLTDVCSMMLIGMGLMKLGVFTGGLSTRSYRWLALAGTGSVCRLTPTTHSRPFRPNSTYWITACSTIVPSDWAGWRSHGHVAVVMLACSAGWLRC